MNRNEALPQGPRQFEIVDVVAIERQARAMQAEAMAGLIRSAWRWIGTRLRRAPIGQTA